MTKRRVRSENEFFDEVRRAVIDRKAGRRTEPFVSETSQPDCLGVADAIRAMSDEEVLALLEEARASCPAQTPQDVSGLDLRDPLTLQALLTVVEALQPVSVGARMQFLLGRKGSLGGLTPLQALEQPTLRAKVLDVARAFAER